MPSANCVFCAIATGEARATIVREWDDALAFAPLDPVTPGHTLVIPRIHIAHFAEDPDVTGAVTRRAAQLAQEQQLTAANLITSMGAAATQTVLHYHEHLVPRGDDRLLLPWSHQQQQAAAQRAAADRAARRAQQAVAVSEVYAYEPVPGDAVTRMFLAGPTPRRRDVESWRPAAIEEIRRQWAGPGQLAILIPEPRDGKWAVDYTQQYAWEHEAMEQADTILFWIPRSAEMPGRTTNIEWGRYGTSGRAVLGVPPEAPQARYNRYLIYEAGKFGTPVAETLTDTVAAAITLAGRHTVRSEGVHA
ncbi:HIT domain-containing protein [Streptomyces sp. SM12]|uniref:HIT domain-containing protein n=1 Tax=Streptomyces sp. SM12 TaxID=1071602 RepID=UPI002156697D|nr:HIT domain-containing protein [Streptomyces sp. SM12]